MKKVELLMSECLRIINDVESYKMEDFHVHCFSALGKFHDALRNHQNSQQIRQRFFDSCSILDARCGSCRDIYEAMSYLPSVGSQVEFLHCVDQDQQALEYARILLAEHRVQARIQWECFNIPQLRPQVKYDLIWLAGLFDYLSDRLAAFLLKRMWFWLKPGGRIVFGNFHPNNPSRLPMELCGQWFLIHRTEDDLLGLVKAADILGANAAVGSEPLGINLFCEIRK